MWRRCDGTLRVSGGFWLLLGWFLYANGWRLLLTVLAAAGLHECGHYAVLRLLGTRVVSMRVGVFGAEMSVPTQPNCVKIAKSAKKFAKRFM